MNLAIAWGYKNNVLIKRSITDGIEFYTGESLEETDTNKLIVSYSDQFGEGYELEEAPLDKLDRLLLALNELVQSCFCWGYPTRESCYTWI